MTAESSRDMIALPGGGAVPVAWRRSGRARRVSLRLDPREAQIVVTLPPRARRDAGLALLRAHADWAAQSLARLPGAVPLANGASVALGGTAHPIRHVPGARGGAWIEAGTIHVAGGAEHVARRVLDLLRREARRRLGAQAAAKAALAGLSYRRLAIKDTRSRWGSCAPDGTLMFSWRLVMAPELVQDYVVAHEVAHLRHMNHGPRFWALVEQLTPHRAEAVAWLAAEGARLHRVG
jgi:predicted metal-dependent hydrolase